MTAAGPTITLADGVRIPQLGLGVWQIPLDDTQRVVEEALAGGYRHIDTAASYDNEEGVGAALAAAGIPRDEVFVTTKLWNADQGHEEARRAFERSLGRLGLDRVDLYLIHWPMPAEDRFVETWRALEEIQGEGRVRSIGVSNFRPEDLERLESETARAPTVNQIELHPRLQQEELRAFHAAHGIVTAAWSPLASGAMFGDRKIEEIAARLGRTAAQVILRWHLQLGNVVIPKTATTGRLAENVAIFDFELDPEDMASIATLETGGRVGPDPATFAIR
ncbi:MAG: aldo/keto reductase [Actinobacteria bacterium]|nr:aldo/keto reductase [Actinomycetota bacterium]OJU83092.1 MAG: oxidoreductase [Solirubrobacterales bacterium 70-9]